MKKLSGVETIFEKVFIETPVDTDGDGFADLIAAYIRRPAAASGDARVPAVLVANPYLMGCNEDSYVPYCVDEDIAVYPQQDIAEGEVRFDFSAPLRCPPSKVRRTLGYAQSSPAADDVEFEAISELYPYLNQKGYATVFCGGLGTLGSEGHTLSGSREEILAFKAVVDWLCGRCRAFTDRSSCIEVKAFWCTGNVAMSAKSYLGTMCIGVAATGVEGLRTIIPEAGISSWYDYYRTGGLNVPALGWQGDDLDTLALYCFSRAKDPEEGEAAKEAYAPALAALSAGQDRTSANYNRFWDERNYLNRIDDFKASVFIIQGLNDWNVKMNQAAPLFKALECRGIERKMLLHQGEHVYVYDLKGFEALSLIERWLDHYLRGEDNGVEKEAAVLVESNLDQSEWMLSGTWPPEGTECRELCVPCSAGETAAYRDDLSATVYDRSADNAKDWLDELVLSESEDYGNRLSFVWDIAEIAKGCGNVRLAGKAKVSFEAALDRDTAILSAMLVDIGEARRITSEQIVCGEDGMYEFGLESAPSAYRVISRGWLNAQNRSALWSKEVLQRGRFYSYEIEMIPQDYTLAAGHKLGLILYGTDVQQTQRPKLVTEITVKLDTVRLRVPVPNSR